MRSLLRLSSLTPASLRPVKEYPDAPDHILMTADTVGGVWTYALTLADALRDYDVEVALATMGDPLSAEQEAAAHALENVEVFESEYQLEWMEDPWDDVEAAGDWLMDLEAQLQPDLVHLNSYAHGSLDWQNPVLVVGHSCVYSWFEAVRGHSPPPRWRRYRREVAWGLRGATRVTAPTEAMLDALERHYGSFARTDAIHNGRAGQDFSPQAEEAFILSAGRLWDDAKNIAALERVAPRLPWPTYVAGDDQHPDGGQRHYEHVHVLGQLTQRRLADWMERASIFALPARYEPFGLSALEAGLAGCALVLGDIPSLREVWGEAAVFVSPHDPKALETTLRELINDDARRTEMARRARDRALRYSPDGMVERYVALYADLLRPTPPAVSSVG